MFHRNNNNNHHTTGRDGNGLKSTPNSSLNAIIIGDQEQSPPIGTTTLGTNKKYTTKHHRWTTTTTLPYQMMIGILLYIVCVQYSIIQTKDAAILTILTHEPNNNVLNPISGWTLSRTTSSSSSGSSKTLQQSRDLFNRKQYQLLERFQKRCDTTTSSTTTTITGNQNTVGVFPIRKPRTDLQTIRKIQQRIQKNVWKPYSSTILTKMSYPIFVPSLPKSGTTSIWKYFKCGYQAACHNWIQGTVPGSKSTLLGKCIERNIQQSLPPFDHCGPYDVYTDSGYLNYDHDSGEQCFYPSIDGLEAIYESYPTITFVNVVRNTEAWYKSIRTWSQASLFVRLRLCNATGFPNGQSTKEDIMRMYDNFNNMIRQFVKDRPSITYIEVQLEANNTGLLLQEATGINSACWKVCKPQDRHCVGDQPKYMHRPKSNPTQRQKSVSSNHVVRKVGGDGSSNNNNEKEDGEGNGGGDDEGDDGEEEQVEEDGNDDDEGI